MIYKIYDGRDDEVIFVELTPDQVRVLQWLEDKQFLFNTVTFEPSDIPKIEKI